jgi:hypothetical protein
MIPSLWLSTLGLLALAVLMGIEFAIRARAPAARDA